jgi:SAM-dependent methyltransferase
MVLDEANLPARWDVKVLASDIDPDALAVAEAGVYAGDRLEAVGAARRAQHFVRGTGDDADRWRIAPRLRERVRFRQLNLFEPWPMRQRFDLIFCRNVVIYFTPEDKRRLVARFAEALAPRRAPGARALGVPARRSAGPGARRQDDLPPHGCHDRDRGQPPLLGPPPPGVDRAGAGRRALRHRSRRAAGDRARVVRRDLRARSRHRGRRHVPHALARDASGVHGLVAALLHDVLAFGGHRATSSSRLSAARG